MTAPINNGAKKMLVFSELLTTERSYLGMISRFAEIFQQLASKHKDSVLSQAEFCQFNNFILSPIGVSTSFLGELEAVDENVQKDPETLDTLFLECWQKFAHRLMAVLGSFTHSYPDWINQLETIATRSKTKAELTKIYQNSTENIIGYFICPVARMPRYLLHLSEMINCYDSDSEIRAGLQQVLEELRTSITQSSSNR